MEWSDALANTAERLGPPGVMILMFSISGGFYFQVDKARPMDALLTWGLGFFMLTAGVLFFTKLIINWPPFPGLDQHHAA